MAKISPVAAKYIVHTTINIEGVVDRPDVIGAIFGQTEGLLGNDLELRELQRSGRIGRIEVNVNTSSGKTAGEIIIPSSLDKTETAIVAAALEIIQRIGPCNAKIEVKKIEDVRISKRQFVIERAKELLKTLTNETLPDSQELADEVAQSVRMTEVCEYGREKLAAGPEIDSSEEIIVVEGRADVLNLLKHGFKNAIALNGTSAPETVRELTKKKTCTVFVDGDRGGDLIVREILSNAEIDFVCKAPDGKEVEEITQKEIHKALRGRITAEQAKLELGIDEHGALKEISDSVRKGLTEKSFQKFSSPITPPEMKRGPENRAEARLEGRFTPRMSVQNSAPPGMNRPVAQSFRDNRGDSNRVSSSAPSAPSSGLSTDEKRIYKQTLEDLFGTRGACIFDEKLNVLGKVPLSELASTIKSLNGGIHALVLDGTVDIELVKVAEKLGIPHVVATGTRVKDAGRVSIIMDDKLAG